MGELSDYMAWYSRTFQNEEDTCDIPSKYIWVSIKGPIDVRKMSDAHINNSIKMMAKKIKPLLVEKLKRIFYIKQKD